PWSRWQSASHDPPSRGCASSPISRGRSDWVPFFSTERCLAHRSVDTQPLPVEPFEEIKELETFHPQFAIDVVFLPLPRVIVDGARRPIRLAGQGMLLDPRAQHEEDPGGNAAEV